MAGAGTPLARLRRVAPVRRITRAVRRLGFRLYHRLQAANYATEAVARSTATPGGTIHTYELADTHGDDALLAALVDRAGPGDVIYDVGAYTGAYALALAVDHPDRTVVAVEPNPRSVRRLERNRERTDPDGKILVQAVGLGESEGAAPFYRSSFPKLSSFDRTDATRWGARVRAVESVPVRPLDSLVGDLPPPDQVKLDVEGHAPAVLRGATETLDRHRPVLYVETHDRPGADRTAAIERIATDHDYRVRHTDGGLVCTPR